MSPKDDDAGMPLVNTSNGREGWRVTERAEGRVDKKVREVEEKL